MEAKTLEKIGLTKNESLVYLALLQIGTSKTGRILKKSGLNSGKIYEILESLKLKGLVSESIINNIRNFTAAPPSKLLEYISRKQDEIRKEEKTVKTLLPQLEKLRKITLGETKSITYTGFEGFKTAIKEGVESLKKGEGVLSMGITGIKEQKFNDFWVRHVKKRQKMKRHSKILLSEKGKYYRDLKGKYVERRVLPGFTPAAVNILGKNITVIINYEKPYSTILIYDKNIAASFTNFFNQLWDKAKTEEIAKIYEGIKESKRFYKRILEDLDKGDCVDVMGVPREANERFEKFFLYWNKKRIKKGIKLRILYNHDCKEFGVKREKMELTQVRYMTQQLETPAWVDIYKDYVVNVNVHGTPICFLMKNKETANSYKKYFEMLWKQAER